MLWRKKEAKKVTQQGAWANGGQKSTSGKVVPEKVTLEPNHKGSIHYESAQRTTVLGRRKSRLEQT